MYNILTLKPNIIKTGGIIGYRKSNLSSEML